MGKRKSKVSKEERKYKTLGVNILKFFAPTYFLVEDRTEQMNSGAAAYALVPETRPIACWYDFANKYQSNLIDLHEKGAIEVEGYDELVAFSREGELILSLHGIEHIFKAEVVDEKNVKFTPIAIHKKLTVSDVHPFTFGIVAAIKSLGAKDFGIITTKNFRAISVFVFAPITDRITRISRLFAIGTGFFFYKVQEKFKGESEDDTIQRFFRFLTRTGESFDFSSLISFLFGSGDVFCLECGSPIFMSPKRGFCCEEHRNRLKARYAVRRRKDKSLPELKEVIDDYLERLKEAKDPKSIWLEIREEYGLNPERRGRKPKRR